MFKTVKENDIKNVANGISRKIQLSEVKNTMDGSKSKLDTTW